MFFCFFCKVFLMETDSSTSAGWLAGSFHLALAGVPFVMLCVPTRFQLCSYLQYHVREGQAHLLLLWLWSTQLLQPWYVENITELMCKIYWYTYVMFLWLNYPNVLFICVFDQPQVLPSPTLLTHFQINGSIAHFTNTMFL